MGTVQVINLDPYSPSSYERKLTMLLDIGHHDDAIDTFETMLSKMSESSESEIRREGNRIILIFFR